MTGIFCLTACDSHRSNVLLPTPEPPIRFLSVQSHDRIGSPLTLTGEAVGTWFFEASFPVRILDGYGNMLDEQPAQALEEWMTTAYVPFSVTLHFSVPATATGTLILEKDNPSGLPAYADAVHIPIAWQ